MIDFACKRFSLDEVLKCGFSLTKSELKLMKYLIKNQGSWLTTEKLAQRLELNLSTVQRAVKKLHEQGTIIRSQENLDNGGYIYLYQAKNKKEIMERTMEIINKWVDKVKTEFEKW